MNVGYARVSSRSQDYQAQVEALKSAGCEKIYSEKKSAKNTERPEFMRLMKALKPGDVVVVTRLNRLVRSSRDLHNVLHDLQEIACGFLSLRENWCNTETPAGKLMLAIVGAINQFEREMIRERCEEGIARAKALGTKFGRHNALDPGQRRKVAQLHAKGATVRSLADQYEVGVATIHRALNGP